MISKKLSLTILAIAISSSSFIIPAHAGVMKRLVEVDAEQRQQEELDRIRRQEEYKKAIQEQNNTVEEPAPAPIPVVTPAPAPAPAPRPEPAPVVSKKNKYENCFVCKFMGSITGAIAGPFVGLARGTVSKGEQYAFAMDEKLGDDTLGNFVGLPVGAVSGAITGAVSGLANGFGTGVVKGYQQPFSKESYSLAGDDYDPYVFLGGN